MFWFSLPYRKDPMKKKTILPILAAGAVLSLASCGPMKFLENDIRYEVYDGTSLIDEGVVNIFNNGLLPNLADRSSDERFYRYYVGEEVPTDVKAAPEERLYPNAGLLRYHDVKDFAVDGLVKVSAIYLDLEDMPRPFLKIGWYDKTSTSKVSQDSIDRWTPDLNAFLSGQGYSQEEVDDVVINPYGHNGNVADLGNEVNKDGLVDVLIGVGANINTTAGVEVKEKYQIVLEDGSTWRYIALLSDRDQAKAVYEWLKTPEGYGALVG